MENSNALFFESLIFTKRKKQSIIYSYSKYNIRQELAVVTQATAFLRLKTNRKGG